MRTRLCDAFGITYPLFGFTPSPEVAAAITRAGGMGVLGAVRYSHPDQLEEALQFMDAHTDGKPYGVDVVIPQASVSASDVASLEKMIDDRHRGFVDELLARHGVPPLPDDAAEVVGITAWIQAEARAQVEVALGHRIALIANALGSPPDDVVKAAHAKGVQVAALAGKAEHARAHAEADVDIIVAVGHEAGGHTGEVTTMVLVPEVVAAVGGRPVLAGGGIGSGEQVAAALALGADGAWMGSIWLTAEEYRLEPPSASGYSIVQEKLLAATSSDTVRSRVISGKPARMLKTEWTEAWREEGSPGTLPMPLQGLLVADAEARIRHHQSRALLGSPVGQIVGRMNAVRPVADMVADLVEGYERAVARLNALR